LQVRVNDKKKDFLLEIKRGGKIKKRLSFLKQLSIKNVFILIKYKMFSHIKLS